MTTIHRLSAGLLSLTMILLLLAGCTKERPRSGAEYPVAPSGVTEVTFALSTGVETYANGPIPAKGYEKDFVKDDKEQIQMLLFKEDGTFIRIAPFKKPDAAHYGIEIKEKGKYKLIIVANHEQLSDLSGKSLDDVKKLIVKKEPGVPNEFVMASDVKDFEVTSNRLADLGTITLTRLAARIDIQTTLEKLELTKVTVKNRKCESALFASTDTDSRTSSTCTEEGKGLYSTFKIFGTEDTSKKSSMGQIYTYENCRSARKGTDEDKAKGTTVEIEAKYGGKEIKTITVPLPQVKRNYIYSIQLVMDSSELDPDDPDKQVGDKDPKDPKDLKITYALEVLDWETGETIVMSPDELIKSIKEQKTGKIYNLRTELVPEVSEFGLKDFDLKPEITITTYEKGEMKGKPEKNTTGGFMYSVRNIEPETSDNWVTYYGHKVTVSPNPDPNPRTAIIYVYWGPDIDHKRVTEKMIVVKQRGALKYNPLAYMAPFNVTKDKKWDRGHTIPTKEEAKGKKTPLLMTGPDAVSTFSTDMKIEQSPQEYHLPSMKEWISIMPKDEKNKFDVSATFFHPEKYTRRDVSEEVMIGETPLTGSSDYLPATLRIGGKMVNCCVALRFKGTGKWDPKISETPTDEKDKYRSAWLYYLDLTKGHEGLRILCVNIAGNRSISKVENLDQNFWSRHYSEAVTRFLPAAGSSNGYQHENAYYLSKDRNGAGQSYWHGYFTVYTKSHAGHAGVMLSNCTDYCRSVRLFSKTPVRE